MTTKITRRFTVQSSPGPWIVGRMFIVRGRAHLPIRREPGVTVATLAAFNEKTKALDAEDHANAVLIAAAPDMLWALREASKALAMLIEKDAAPPQYAHAVQMAVRDCIAKAEGRA